MAGTVRVGIGGWSFEPWRGTFYPDKLAQAKELGFASRALSSIEINASFYSSFKPETWRKWRDETPDDFVFTVKASRYCTSRKSAADSAPAIKRFLEQGLTELGPKLGVINWQFPATRKFDAHEMATFLDLLPPEHDGLRLRHVIEADHESFDVDEFKALLARHEVAKVSDAVGPDPGKAPLAYVRLQITDSNLAAGVHPKDLDAIAAAAKRQAKHGDVFVFFIAAAKEKNPAAAKALIARLS